MKHTDRFSAYEVGGQLGHKKVPKGNLDTEGLRQYLDLDLDIDEDNAYSLAPA